MKKLFAFVFSLSLACIIFSIPTALAQEDDGAPDPGAESTDEYQGPPLRPEVDKLDDEIDALGPLLGEIADIARKLRALKEDREHVVDPKDTLKKTDGLDLWGQIEALRKRFDELEEEIVEKVAALRQKVAALKVRAMSELEGHDQAFALQDVRELLMELEGIEDYLLTMFLYFY